MTIKVSLKKSPKRNLQRDLAILPTGTYKSQEYNLKYRTLDM